MTWRHLASRGLDHSSWLRARNPRAVCRQRGDFIKQKAAGRGKCGAAKLATPCLRTVILTRRKTTLLRMGQYGCTTGMDGPVLGAGPSENPHFSNWATLSLVTRSRPV